jgi:MRC1-like domain
LPSRKSSRNTCELIFGPRLFLWRVDINTHCREHQTADDARIEKEVQDVVAGKRRTRRRGGAGGLLGSDESDEDEDDEEARALRQRLAKKRRVEGDTLDALARDPATASFHATYQMALVDDADEFAHLDRDQELDSEPEPGRDRGEDEGEGNDRDDGSEGEEGDGRRKRGGASRAEQEEDVDEDVEMAEPSMGTEKGKGRGEEEISTAEVRKKLQEVARGERVRISLQLTASIFFFEKRTN